MSRGKVQSLSRKPNSMHTYTVDHNNIYWSTTDKSIDNAQRVFSTVGMYNEKIFCADTDAICKWEIHRILNI